MYHAGVIKLTQRMTGGFLFQGSYTYSKLMTNADAFSGSTGPHGYRPAGHGILDRPFRSDPQHQAQHRARASVGPGKRWLNSGVGSHILSGWRIAAVQSYVSGLPIGVTTSAPLAGDEFNPLVDRFLNRSAFAQPVGQLGNAPRIVFNRIVWGARTQISTARTLARSQRRAIRPGRCSSV